MRVTCVVILFCVGCAWCGVVPGSVGTISTINATDAISTIQHQPLSIVSLKQRNYFDSKYKHFCTGTILSKDWILTAGHCFTHRSVFNKGVVIDAGSEYLSNTNGTRYPVADFHIHPNQSESIQIYKNDLCLLKLETSIQFTPNIQPTRLGTIKDQKELPVVASGWGRTSQTGGLHQKLRYLDLQTMKYEDCKRIHARRNNLVDTETHICGFAGVGKSLCFGDSGGPLVDPATGYQVGVFSALEDCSGEYPVLFMKMEPFIDWINDVTKLNLTLN